MNREWNSVGWIFQSQELLRVVMRDFNCPTMSIRGEDFSHVEIEVRAVKDLCGAIAICVTRQDELQRAILPRYVVQTNARLRFERACNPN